MNKIIPKQQITDRLQQLGCPTPLPWRVAAQSYSMTAREIEKFRQISIDCFHFLETIALLIQENHDAARTIVRTITGNDRTLKMIQLILAREKTPPLVMVRPDIIRRSNGQLCVIEMETMIGGIGVGTIIRTAYDAKGFPGIPASYSTMVRDILTKHRGNARRTFNDHVSIGVINPDSKTLYDWEFRALTKYMSTYSISLNLGRPEDIDVAQGIVRLHGQEIDALHRFFRASELAEQSSAFTNLTRIAQKQHIPMLQPWIELLEEKALMAFLHDPAFSKLWNHRLGTDTYHRLKEAVPPTWIVGPHADFIREVYNSPKKDRAFWLKKSGNAWGGRAAYFGSEVNNNKWQSLLKTAMTDYLSGRLWILQEHRQAAPEAIACYDSETDEASTPVTAARFSPLLFWSNNNLTLADFYVTVRSNHKVHGATDATFLPVDLHHD